MRFDWKCFQVEESGAVTVDWVVLTAALVGIAVLALTPIAYGTQNMATRLSDYVGNTAVGP